MLDATGKHTARRIQRWFGLDANPLRRASDRVESVARIASCMLAALAVVVAVQLAQATYHTEGHRADAYRAHHDRVDAVLVTDAAHVDLPAAPLGEVPATSGPSQATASWIGPDGKHHTGFVPAAVGTRAGAQVPIWVDEHGALAQPPPTNPDVATTAVMAGIGAYLGMLMALTMVCVVLRRLLDIGRARRWARQWEQVSSHWNTPR